MIWRNATHNEAYKFYTDHFPEYVSQLPEHVTADGPREYGLSFFNSYPVKKSDRPPVDFIRRKTWKVDYDDNPQSPWFSGILDGDRPLVRFLQNPAAHDPIRGTDKGLVDPKLTEGGHPIPAGVYHSLTYWNRSHIVAVDIDAKDIAYQRAAEMVETENRARSEIFQDAGITQSDPVGYPYEFTDIRRALEYGFTVRDIFRDDFNASRTLVVYSGQGCHVYLLDDDRHHQYDTYSREVLATLLTEEYEIPIDRQVTVDSARLIRVPYSLHTDVCRVVQPVSSPSFNFRTQAQPEYLQPEVA